MYNKPCGKTSVETSEMFTWMLSLPQKLTKGTYQKGSEDDFLIWFLDVFGVGLVLWRGK